MHTPASYDYVIVGAGSAGCVLAARLTEDPQVNVLVLEAGPHDQTREVAMPAGAPMLWRDRGWGDLTTPQPGLAGRRINLVQGRTVGGGSSVNYMVYMRGNRADYDEWRDAYGCDGWSYADLLPYFRRAEDQARGEDAFHGVGGPLRVEDLRYRHLLSEAWLSAALESGLTANDDFNGAEQHGVGYLQTTQRSGRRWSAADAYLHPVRDRENLTVRTGATVTQVLLENARAIGVRYRYGGAVVDVRAEAEVVLSSGAIRTPQLLMLSGVGPADQVRTHGIDVVVDSPRVGTGLQDHPYCAPEWHTPDIENWWEALTPHNLERWEREQRGPFSTMGAEVGGFVRVHSDSPAPDLQLGAIPGPAPDDAAPPDRRAVSTMAIVAKPRSRGKVTLASADPAAAPIVDPAYLSDEADLEILIAGVRLAREITARRPLAGLTAEERAPGSHARSDAQLREWVRRSTTTVFHPAGTCAMGSNVGAVCDPSLRVRGVDGLRVVDASLMPALPRGNTNAPTIALAERAADLIRGTTVLAPDEPLTQGVNFR